MSQTFTVEPGLSTDGPVVRFGNEGSAFLHPQAAAALALDLVAASAIARYEAALVAVLDNRGSDRESISEIMRSVRDELNTPPPSADPAPTSETS